jgi:hypothetical protein
MVTLNGPQVDKTTDSQSLLIALALINHSVNMLSEDFPCLYDNRLIMLPKLLVKEKCAFDGGGGNDLFDGLDSGLNWLMMNHAPHSRIDLCEFDSQLPCLNSGGRLGAVQLPGQSLWRDLSRRISDLNAVFLGPRPAYLLHGSPPYSLNRNHRKKFHRKSGTHAPAGTS